MFQLILKSLVFIFTASVYSHKALPRHDDLLTDTINQATTESVAGANDDGATVSPTCGFGYNIKRIIS